MGFLKDFGLPAYVVATISLIVYSYKKFKEVQERKNKITKEQLDSIIEHFEKEDALTNNFVLEQVFEYKFKSYIPAKAIRYLLQCANPTYSIKNYILGKSNLVFNFDNEEFSYRGKLSNELYRKRSKFFSITIYFVFAFMGLGIVLNSANIAKYLDFPWVIALIPLSIYFLFIAYDSVMSAIKISSAEDIMREVEYSKNFDNCDEGSK